MVLLAVGVAATVLLHIPDDLGYRLSLRLTGAPVGAVADSCMVLHGRTCVVPPATGAPVPEPPARAADRVGVPYGPEPHHLADLWIPAGDGPHPVLVWLHGGGWIAGSRASVPPLVHHLAGAGWLVVSADYRLATPEEGSFPGAVHDVHRVVGWVVEHAPGLGSDPDAIVLAGASAGGHLALMGALTSGTAPAVRAGSVIRVAGVVSMAGVTHLPTFSQGEHPWASALPRAFLGCGDRDCPAAVLHEASPTEWVGRDAPPVYLVAGAHDELVPPDQAHRLAAHLDALGGRHPRVWLDVVGHAGHNVGIADVSLDALEAFLSHATGYGSR